MEFVSVSGGDATPIHCGLSRRCIPHPVSGFDDLQRDRADASGADPQRGLPSHPAVGRCRRRHRRVAVSARSLALQRSVQRCCRRSHHPGAFDRDRRLVRVHPRPAQLAEGRRGPGGGSPTPHAARNGLPGRAQLRFPLPVRLNLQQRRQHTLRGHRESGSLLTRSGSAT